MENGRKTVLITGGSRGIGRATAALFGEKGWNVVFSYHSREQEAGSLIRKLKEMGCHGLAVQADVADRRQVTEMVLQAERAFGMVDVLVNNAGIAQQKLFTDISEKEWDRLFDVDVKGVFHCCQAVLPAMLREHQGKIINIASMWGEVGASCEVHYSAAKAAVIGLTKALAKEVGPSGIQVNCVSPGVIATEMNQYLDESALKTLREDTPLSMIGQPEDVAKAIWFLASSDSNFITGQVLGTNGGFVI